MGETRISIRALKAGLFALAAMAGAAAPAYAQTRASGQLYDLPLFANDLNAGERYYTRDHADTVTQKFGYDITARRLTGGKWTSLKPGVTDDAHWDDPKNTNYFVYGKPFYAMKDGTVIACWRNAPQNPRPKRPEEDNEVATEDKAWIHQDLKDGLMPGGGNHLWILHDDGTRALYAHAQTGSIPASLCPRNQTNFGTAPDKDAVDENGMYAPIALAPSERRRVTAGQKLGLIGHSGSSTGPHLHVHVERKNANGIWVGDPMRFTRGMSTPWNNGKAGIDQWSSFSGKPITKGEVLFWPPTRLGKEYARHKAGADSFQRMFDHLANSGYQPKIINGYSVGGKVYLNHVWEPAAGSWRAFSRQTQAAHQANLDKAKADGFAPVFIDSYLENGEVRYAAIYRKGAPGEWLLRSNLTAQQHDSVLDDAKAKGLKPASVSVVSIGGERRYTALYRADNIGGWALKSQILESEYQGVVNEQLAAGRMPLSLDAYMHDGKPYIAAIFATKYNGKSKARHALTTEAYQSEAESAWGAGMVTQSVAAFYGAQSQHRYGAVWVKP